ncbi:hypothetical protein [Rhizobium binxianense]
MLKQSLQVLALRGMFRIFEHILVPLDILLGNIAIHGLNPVQHDMRRQSNLTFVNINRAFRYIVLKQTLREVACQGRSLGMVSHIRHHNCENKQS